MNTKINQKQTNRRQGATLKASPKKQKQNRSNDVQKFHEHERIETRMTD